MSEQSLPATSHYKCQSTTDYPDPKISPSLQVSSVIEATRGFLHGTPLCALNLQEKWHCSCRNSPHLSSRSNDKNWNSDLPIQLICAKHQFIEWGRRCGGLGSNAHSPLQELARWTTRPHEQPWRDTLLLGVELVKCWDDRWRPRWPPVPNVDPFCFGVSFIN